MTEALTLCLSPNSFGTTTIFGSLTLFCAQDLIREIEFLHETRLFGAQQFVEYHQQHFLVPTDVFLNEAGKT